MVDVDEGHRQRALVAIGSLDFREQADEQRLAIADAGQLVVGGGVRGLGQGHRDRVDRPAEPALDAALARSGGDDRDHLTGGETLGGLDQPAQAEADIEEHDPRGEGHAHGAGQDRGEDRSGALVGPRVDRLWIGDPDDEQGNGCEESQPPEQTHHGS